MAYNIDAKKKLLVLKQILEDYTDNELGLTMSQILNKLQEEYGISAERKSIYRDLDLLRDCGVDVVKLKVTPVQYAINHRRFSLRELQMLVDAVDSCKALSYNSSRKLIKAIKGLTAEKNRGLLNRDFRLPQRVKSNSSVNDTLVLVDTISCAIRDKKQIIFKYQRYDVTGRLRYTNNGIPHTVTPIYVAYIEDFYYLKAWDEGLECIRHFRIDRMDALMVSDEPASKNDIIRDEKQIDSNYTHFAFFNGEPKEVTLDVAESVIGAVYDRFGIDDVALKPNENRATMIVKVKQSDQFFGWIAGMGGKIRIVNEDINKDYQEFLKQNMSVAEGFEIID